MTYIGVSPSNGVRRVHTYTATGSQTSFTGASSEGITLSYTDANFVDVYQNGVLLAPADYTATSGTSIVLGEGAAASDIVTITVYDAFSVADTVSKSAGGTFDGNVAMAGTLGVTGVLTGTSLDISGDIDIDGTANLDAVDIDGAVDMATTLTLAGNADFNGDLDVDGTSNLDVVDIDGTLNVAGETTLQTHLNMGDGDTIKLGASADLQIKHSGTLSLIDDQGTGVLEIRTNGDDIRLTGNSGSDFMFRGISNGAASLYHDGSEKIATTSSGATVTGSLLTTNIYGASDGNTGIQWEGSDVLTFHSGGVENIQLTSNAIVFNQDSVDMDLRIESNNKSAMFFIDGGNDRVGIGTDSPTVDLQVEGAGNTFIYLTNSSSNDGLYMKAGTGASSLQTGGGSHVMNFFTSGNERMRIHSSGQVGIGQTANQATLCIFGHQQSYTGLQIKNGTNNGSTFFAMFVRSNGSGVGSIQQTADGNGTTFNTTSDYRLKESISYDFDATTRLKQLKPCRFVFKESLTGQTVDGFLAHEVQTIVPEAISGEKDATNEDGSIKPQGIDQSKLVPLLVKTIQELEARIETLEASQGT